MGSDGKPGKRPSRAATKGQPHNQDKYMYRIIADKSLGGVYIIQGGIFKYINAYAAAVVGFRPEELIGKKALILVHPEDKELQRQQAIEMLQGKRSTPYEFRIVIKDGSIRWIMETVTPMLYDGKPAVLVNAMDITESKQAEELYRILAEKSFGGVYVVQDGIFRYLNANAAAYAGYSSAELTGQEAPSIIHPEDKEIQRKHSSEMLKGKSSCPHEFRIVSKSGDIRWIMETVTPIFYKGKPAALGNSMDITSLKEATKKLEEQRELVTSIVDSIPEAVIVVKGWQIEFANNAFNKIFGWMPDDIIGKHAGLLYRSEEDFKASDKEIQYKLQSQRNCNQEVLCRRKDYRIIVCQQHAGLIGENLQTGKLVLIYDDITERKRAQELIEESEKRFQELSIKDNLTKLYNNRRFHELLQLEIARTNRYNHPMTLLMIDIDNFKRYNDTYGHVEGDTVLARFAEILQGNIRETDHACRYGGEEFVVILPDTLGDTAFSIAERIREEFKKEIFTPRDGSKEHITISVGVAQFITKEDPQGFIKRADKRMYKAKQKGKDQVCY